MAYRITSINGSTTDTRIGTYADNTVATANNEVLANELITLAQLKSYDEKKGTAVVDVDTLPTEVENRTYRVGAPTYATLTNSGSWSDPATSIRSWLISNGFTYSFTISGVRYYDYNNSTKPLTSIGEYTPVRGVYPGEYNFVVSVGIQLSSAGSTPIIGVRVAGGSIMTKYLYKGDSITFGWNEGSERAYVKETELLTTAQAEANYARLAVENTFTKNNNFDTSITTPKIIDDTSIEITTPILTKNSKNIVITVDGNEADEDGEVISNAVVDVEELPSTINDKVYRIPATNQYTGRDYASIGMENVYDTLLTRNAWKWPDDTYVVISVKNHNPETVKSFYISSDSDSVVLHQTDDTIYQMSSGTGSLIEYVEVPTGYQNERVYAKDTQLALSSDITDLGNHYVKYVSALPSPVDTDIVYGIDHTYEQSVSAKYLVQDFISTFMKKQGTNSWLLNDHVTSTYATITYDGTDYEFNKLYWTGKRYVTYIWDESTGTSTRVGNFGINIGDTWNYALTWNYEHKDYYVSDSTNAKTTQLANMEQVEDWYIKKEELGRANGVAVLDGDGKIPKNELNFTALNFLGMTHEWPTDEDPEAGDFYIVDQQFTHETSTLNPGDWIIYFTEWQIEQNSNIVSSVNGKIGVVVLTGDDINVTYESTTDTINNTLPKLGKVNTVNNVEPDSDKNVEIDGDDINVTYESTTDTINNTLPKLGKVNTVNGVEPDSNKNVEIDGDDINVTYESTTDTLNNTLPKLGKVKTVNDVEPDTNGNIDVNQLKDEESEGYESIISVSGTTARISSETNGSNIRSSSITANSATVSISANSEASDSTITLTADKVLINGNEVMPEVMTLAEYQSITPVNGIIYYIREE